MGWQKGWVCTSSVRGAAEGVEDSAEALSPWVGERPQKWSGTQALS